MPLPVQPIGAKANQAAQEKENHGNDYVMAPAALKHKRTVDSV